MRTVAVVYGIFMLAAGLGYLIAPDGLAALVQQSFTDVAARTDFRATYGGFHLALGWHCLQQRHTVSGLRQTFALLTTVVACVALIRIAGVLLEPGHQTLNFAASVIEFLSAGFTGYCAWRLRPVASIPAGADCSTAHAS